MENDFEVYSRDELAAALCAGARETFAEARVNPFSVRLASTGTVYRFSAGLRRERAESVRIRLMKTPARAFK
jgi:hypothetical protein